MNNLEQKHLNELYEHEYEEIPNSALYKFNYEEAAIKSAEITSDIAIKFAKWKEEGIASFEIRKTNINEYYVDNIDRKSYSLQELFDYFITNHYGK